jgi:hypothetical protein
VTAVLDMHWDRMHRHELQQLTPEYLEERGYTSELSFILSGRDLPHGTVTKSIKSSGGDYSSLSSWEAALPATLTDNQVAEYQEAFADTTACTINGVTVGSYTILVTVATGYRNSEDSGWDTDARTALGAGARIELTSSAHCLSSQLTNTTIEHLHLYNKQSSGSGIVLRNDKGTTQTWRYLFCVYDDTRSTMVYSKNSSSDITFAHSLVWKLSTGATLDSNGVFANGGTLNCYHLTVVVAHNSTRYCFRRGSGGTLNLYNCMSYNPTSAGSEQQAGSGGDYNGSTDSSAIGTNKWTNIVEGNFFVSTTASSEDWRIDSSNDGSYEGADKTADVGSVDYFGNTVSDHDIGFAQITTSGATISLGVVAGEGELNTPTLSPGAVTLQPSPLEGEGSLLDVTMSPGGVTVSPSPVAGEGALLDVSFNLTTMVPITAVEGEGSILTPTISLGAVTVSPAAVEGLGELLDPSILPGTVTVALGIAEGEAAVQDVSVAPGTVTLLLGVVEGEAALLDPTVSPGAVTVVLGVVEGVGELLDPRFPGEPFTYSGRLKWVRQVSRELSRMVFRKAEQVR